MFPASQNNYDGQSKQRTKSVGQIALTAIGYLSLIVLGYVICLFQLSVKEAQKAEHDVAAAGQRSVETLRALEARPTPAPRKDGKSAASFPDALIREKLKRDYPDDYVTQKGVYDMQREAFDFMESLPPSRIKSKVQRDYPNDFVTQKGVYEMQIESKKAMQ